MKKQDKMLIEMLVAFTTRTNEELEQMQRHPSEMICGVTIMQMKSKLTGTLPRQIATVKQLLFDLLAQNEDNEELAARIDEKIKNEG